MAVYALVRSQNHRLDLAPLIAHYGDSLLPYLPVNQDGDIKRFKNISMLPIVVKSKMKYVKVKPLLNNRTLWDRQTAFPDSTLKGPRREIRSVYRIR